MNSQIYCPSLAVSVSQHVAHISRITRLNCLNTSYLGHRFQAIKIGSTLSELHELLFYIPQGSVLGPLLFLLYTVLLSKVIGRHPNVKFHFYANDTCLFVEMSHKNVALAFDKLNSCLQDVQVWLN